MSKFAFGERSLKCLKGVHPDLVKVLHHAIETSRADFGVHCGLRTLKQQRALVNTGKSRTMRSRHLSGHAVDLHPWINRNIPWDDWECWRALARHIKSTARDLRVQIEWGGDWKTFKDGPHFQLPWDEYPGVIKEAA